MDRERQIRQQDELESNVFSASESPLPWFLRLLLAREKYWGVKLQLFPLDEHAAE
jgi:hypothetical protein